MGKIGNLRPALSAQPSLALQQSLTTLPAATSPAKLRLLSRAAAASAKLQQRSGASNAENDLCSKDDSLSSDGDFSYTSAPVRVVQSSPMVSAIGVAVHFQPIILLQQRLLISRVLRLWSSCLISAVPIQTIVKRAVASHSRRTSGLCIFMEWTMLKSKFEFHRLWRSLHPPGCCAINDAKRFLQDAYAVRLAIQHASPHTTWCRAFLKARVPSLLPRHYRVANMMQFLSAMDDSWYVSMITSWHHRVKLSKVTPAPQASLQSSAQLPKSAFIAMANLAAGVPTTGSSPPIDAVLLWSITRSAALQHVAAAQCLEQCLTLLTHAHISPVPTVGSSPPVDAALLWSIVRSTSLRHMATAQSLEQCLTLLAYARVSPAPISRWAGSLDISTLPVSTTHAHRMLLLHARLRYHHKHDTPAHRTKFLSWILGHILATHAVRYGLQCWHHNLQHRGSVLARSRQCYQSATSDATGHNGPSIRIHARNAIYKMHVAAFASYCRANLPSFDRLNLVPSPRIMVSPDLQSPWLLSSTDADSLLSSLTPAARRHYLLAHHDEYAARVARISAHTLDRLHMPFAQFKDTYLPDTCQACLAEYSVSFAPLNNRISTPHLFRTYIGSLRYSDFLYVLLAFRSSADAYDRFRMHTATALLPRTMARNRLYAGHDNHWCDQIRTASVFISSSSGDWVCHTLASTIGSVPYHDFRLSAYVLGTLRFSINSCMLLFR